MICDLDALRFVIKRSKHVRDLRVVYMVTSHFVITNGILDAARNIKVTLSLVKRDICGTSQLSLASF